MAGYHWGMRRKTDFGRFAVRSLAGQSIGTIGTYFSNNFRYLFDRFVHPINQIIIYK
jgi:hypothetical protein